MTHHILRAIRDGEFNVEDFSDATIQEAIRDGLIEFTKTEREPWESYPAWDGRFELTTQGEAEIHDDEYDAHRDHPKPGSRGDK